MALAAAVVITPGCSTKSAATTQARADTTPSASAVKAAALATRNLSDGNILAIVDEVNMADSALGAMAVSRAKSSDVKSFAKAMSGDHHALRDRGRQLAAAQHITLEMPPDPFKPAIEAEEDSQGQAPQGRVFDSTYVAKQIELDQAVLGWTDRARNRVKNPSLKDYLAAADSVVQQHLNRAHSVAKAWNSSS